MSKKKPRGRISVIRSTPDKPIIGGPVPRYPLRELKLTVEFVEPMPWHQDFRRANKSRRFHRFIGPGRAALCGMVLHNPTSIACEEWTICPKCIRVLRDMK